MGCSCTGAASRNGTDTKKRQVVKPQYKDIPNKNGATRRIVRRRGK